MVGNSRKVAKAVEGQHLWLYTALTATSFATMLWGGVMTGRADTQPAGSKGLQVTKQQSGGIQNQRSQALKNPTRQAAKTSTEATTAVDASGASRADLQVSQSHPSSATSQSQNRQNNVKTNLTNSTVSQSPVKHTAQTSVAKPESPVSAKATAKTVPVGKNKQSSNNDQAVQTTAKSSAQPGIQAKASSSAEIRTLTDNSRSQGSAANRVNQQALSGGQSASLTNSQNMKTTSVAADISKTDLKALKEQLATENATTGRPQQIVRSLAATALPADTVVSGQTNTANMPAFSPSNSHQFSTDNLAVAVPLANDTFQGSVTSSPASVSIGGNGTGNTGLMNRIALHLNTFRNTPFLYTADPGLTISGGILGISAIDNRVTQNFNLSAETLLSRLKYSNNGQVGNIPDTFSVSLSSSDLPANTIIYDSDNRSWTLSSSALMGVAKLNQSILDLPFTVTVTDPASPATTYNGKFNVLFAVAPAFTVHATQNDRISGKQIGTATDDLTALPNVLSRGLNLTTPAGYSFIDSAILSGDPLYHQDISTVVTPAEVYNLKVWYMPNDAQLTANYTTTDGKTVLAPADSIPGKFAQTYSTTAKTIPGYTLTAAPNNADGTYAVNAINVNYLYTPDTESVNVTYKTVSGNAVADSVTLSGNYGTQYPLSAKTISGYKAETAPTNASGSFATDNPDIAYLYQPETETVQATYQDNNGNQLIDPVTLTGDFKTSYPASDKTFAGYHLKATPTNATGSFGLKNADIMYVYAPDTESVQVNYLDAQGQPVIAPVTIKGAYKTDYPTTSKVIAGYTLTKTPANASGQFDTVNADINYEYKINAESVRVTYQDENGTQLESPVTLTGDFGAAYPESAKEIEGYTVKAEPENATSQFAVENPDINYIYQPKDESVIATYQAENGQSLIDPVSYTGKYNTVFPKTDRTFTGYRLKSVPTNVADKFGTTNANIAYVYTPDTEQVVVEYVDENGRQITNAKILNGKFDEDYPATAQTFSGYQLSVTPDNANGKFGTNNPAIRYVFLADDEFVTAQYQDEAGKEIADAANLTGKYNTSYPNSVLPITGYTLLDIPANANDRFDVQNAPIVYQYSLNDAQVMVKYVNQTGDALTSALVQKGKYGQAYETSPAVISGYHLVKTSDNAAGFYGTTNQMVTYVYEVDGTSSVASEGSAGAATSQNSAGSVTSETSAQSVASQSSTGSVTSETSAQSVASQSSTGSVSSETSAQSVASQSSTGSVSSETSAQSVASQSSTGSVSSETSAESVTSQTNAGSLTSESSAESVASQTSTESVTSEGSAQSVTSQSSTGSVTSATSAQSVTSQTRVESVTSETNAQSVASQTSAESATSETSAESTTSQINTGTVISDTSTQSSASQTGPSSLPDILSQTASTSLASLSNVNRHSKGKNQPDVLTGSKAESSVPNNTALATPKNSEQRSTQPTAHQSNQADRINASTELVSLTKQGSEQVVKKTTKQAAPQQATKLPQTDESSRNSAVEPWILGLISLMGGIAAFGGSKRREHH